MGEYRRLDFSNLKFSNEPISFDEALANTPAFNLSDDIISGQKKIHITKAEKDYKNKCVKLEISY